MQGVGYLFRHWRMWRAVVGVDGVSFIAIEYKVQFFLGLISLGLIVLGIQQEYREYSRCPRQVHVFVV
jgi:hypothetical protein